MKYILVGFELLLMVLTIGIPGQLAVSKYIQCRNPLITVL